jgi:ferredoxin
LIQGDYINPHKIKLVYFSPTDSTKNILYKIVEEMDLSIDEEFNLTNYEYKDFKHSFDENDVILLGFPVYGGRVPEPARNRFNGLRGNGSKIVIILTYGDVHYSDSLIEISEIIKNHGFTIIGMGTFVSQHSIVKSVGFDRPNKEDYKIIKYFGKKLVEKLDRNEDFKIELGTQKSFGKYSKLPLKPKVKNNCSQCGLCAKLCPKNAIETYNLLKTNKSRCICCMRCVKYCPNNARDLTRIEYFISKIFLEIVRKIKFKKENKSEIIV